FVDIGVHQDGLVHISEIADHFIKHPSDELELGQIVKVKVIGIDIPRKRISLSIKQVA
ncbi:MAG: S1 RNA-binding domain-containing protein, partial [Mollicutes bacterium]|nr:S1 RNA-binding domain-containing protein [Mollicutes bacterium]